jgi:two-component system, chemotaxis family, chemotaxis protein CheY
MTQPTINLRDLIVLVADGSSYFSMLVHGMLRGFGTSKVIDARTSVDALRILSSQRIDVLICDAKLPPNGGHALIRALRRKADHDHRTIPILMMSADTRETTVKRARDAGANMLIAKPMSPTNLYGPARLDRADAAEIHRRAELFRSRPPLQDRGLFGRSRP